MFPHTPHVEASRCSSAIQPDSRRGVSAARFRGALRPAAPQQVGVRRRNAIDSPGSAGRPPMSKGSTRQRDRGLNDATIAPTSATRGAPSGGRGEKEREEEQVRQAESRKSPGRRERERERAEHARGCSVTMWCVGPRQTEIRVDERDEAGDPTTHDRRSKKRRNQNPPRLIAASFVKFASDLDVGRVQDAASAPNAAATRARHRRARAAARARRARTSTGMTTAPTNATSTSRRCVRRRGRRARTRRSGSAARAQPRPPRAGSIRRKLAPPVPDDLEGVPERGLGRPARRARRRGRARRAPGWSACTAAARRTAARGVARAGTPRALTNASASSPITTSEPGLDDVQLAPQPRAALVLRPVDELEAVRPVDRHRVDAEPLQRLEHRLPGAAEEGDALLQLGRLRPVLDEEDVRQRMARAEHRHALAAARRRSRARAR